MREARLASVFILAISMFLGCQEADVSPAADVVVRPAEDIVRGIVADQWSIQFDLISQEIGSAFLPKDITVQDAGSLGAGVKIFRAYPPTDHTNGYLVAVKDSHVYALGGFPSVELLKVASLIRAPEVDSASLWAAAMNLAALADPNGATEVLFPGIGETPAGYESVVAVWDKERPIRWPRYAITIGADSRWRIRLTLLSRLTASYFQNWTPSVYEFLFEPDGELTRWARRTGSTFSATLDGPGGLIWFPVAEPSSSIQ